MQNGHINILLVDDRPEGLLSMEAVLKDSGYQILTASSGKEALAILDQHEFAVILLDVQMPDLDGFETAKLMKEHIRGKHVPIIFITAINKENSHVSRGYDTGAADYIFKPFSPLILRSKVTTFADLYRMRLKIEEQSRNLIDSERKEREYRIAQLQLKNLKRYRNLADAIPHIVWKAQADGVVDYVNRYWCEYTGLNEEQSQGAGWLAQFHPADIKRFMNGWKAAWTRGDDFEMECRIRGKDGEMRWFLIRVVSEKSENEIIAWIGTCTDIHISKIASEKIVQANEWLENKVKERTEKLEQVNESLKQIQKEVIQISEAERCRLGQDLHDSLAQELTGATFMIQSVRTNWGEMMPEKSQRVFSDALELLKNAMENCRRLSRNLYPIELERNGLAMALSEMAIHKSKIFSIRCHFSCQGLERDEESQVVKTQLYRIVQELVQNAIRHAEAKNIFIRLNNREHEILIEVKDDGKGIQNPQVEKTGMGFRIMNHRARLIGAEIAVDSSSDGTTVRCILPRSIKSQVDSKLAPDVAQQEAVP